MIKCVCERPATDTLSEKMCFGMHVLFEKTTAES